MSEIIFTDKQIQEIKARAETQFNWANTTVLSLIATIAELDRRNEELKIKSKAGFDFISKQIKAFESEPLDENGKHNLYVGKEFLERAKKALLNLEWIE